MRLLTLAWALLCGSAAAFVGMPLPWIIGPMFGVGLLTYAGHGARQPAWVRKAGQITIGIALGLYFTPAVIRELTLYAGWMVLGAVFSLGLTAGFARLFQRIGRTDGPTAIYASAIGAASDMAIAAQRAGANGAAVASAHALRVMMVVTVVSFLAAFMAGPAAASRLAARTAEIAPQTLAVLMLLALLAAWAISRTRMPNPWVLVPLAIAAGYAAMGNETRLPDVLVNGGSVLIGWALGQHMTRDFFRASPRILLAAFVMTLGMLALSLLFAGVIAAMMGLPMITAIVATSPGGIAEMAITAKVLGLGAPVVTAFHLVRLVSVILLIRPLCLWLVHTGWIRLSCNHKQNDKPRA